EGSKTFTVNVNVEGTQRVAHSTVTVVHKQRIAFTEPMGDIKVNEGQALKLSWEDIDPLPETLYQVFLTNVNDPMEERIMLADKAKENDLEFTVPFNVVNEE